MSLYRNPPVADLLNVALTRRAWLVRTAAAMGVAASSGALLSSLAACSDATSPDAHTVIDLATEPGVLNFCYAVLQLEADFFGRVTAAVYPGMTATESTSFSGYRSAASAAVTDLQNTQTNGRITDLVLFRLGQAVDFSDRTSTLTAAQIIEDAAAGGLAAAVAAVSTPAIVTKVTALAAAAATRAAAIRTFAGSAPQTVAPIPPATVMTTLAPYYLTTFTVVHS